MIFDCFLFNSEKECLDIRVAELSELDIIHIAVQANKTFTNKPKEIHPFWYVVDRKDVLVCVSVTDMPDGDDPWARERHQRNCITRGLESANAKDDDLVIISDADEIPRAEAIKKYNPSMGLTVLMMDKMGYWLNCVEGRQSWPRAKIMTYERLKQSSPDEVRNAGHDYVIENGGWHFSYLGDYEKNIKKLESFSHTECNRDDLKEKLAYKIETGQSLWGDDFWEIVQIDESFPKYVQEHQYDTLKHLIKQI